MNELLALILLPPLWFAANAVVLLVLSCVYVHALLGVARLPAFFKVVASVVLWLAFSAVCVAPLFGWIFIARLHLPVALELPTMLWPLLCFGLCFVAVYRPVKRHLPQLRAVGFFRR
ncbi:hypothetical protein [Methylibium rhizosphaerae]|uniref:hypothetical protein n=1 Tax=Methylibium rhizosphaerae TaxID=2570323 RepID=UPI00112B47C1|nr:hypothetical protein [Methylibium rhizosphaerae]